MRNISFSEQPTDAHVDRRRWRGALLGLLKLSGDNVRLRAVRAKTVA